LEIPFYFRLRARMCKSYYTILPHTFYIILIVGWTPIYLVQILFFLLIKLDLSFVHLAKFSLAYSQRGRRTSYHGWIPWRPM